MTIPEFTALLKQPRKASGEYLPSLKKISEDYPYFQAVKALYLKTLKEQDSFDYNPALKHTAAYTTDRSVLFDFITSDIFSQQHTAEHINKRIFDINAIEVTAETFVVETFNKEENEAILNPELFRPKDTMTQETPQEETTPEEAQTSPETQLQIGKPLSFNPGEMHSFGEWLKLSSPKPIERTIPEKEEKTQEQKTQEAEEENATVNEKQKEKFDRIDKFIEKNPKIAPRKEIEIPRSFSGKTIMEKSDLMTETLARVYLEQKKFKKAIQAYTILSLKYPEKSGFFADQIKAIKQLQKNK